MSQEPPGETMNPFCDSPVQAFDLPDQFDLDRVRIYENDDQDGLDYYAVLYVHEGKDSDGYEHYREPMAYVVSDALMAVIDERTDMDIERIDLDRDLPTDEI